MTAYANFDEASWRPPESRARQGEETPEALRRRAEALLDEMMLGAVDGGGADYGAPSVQPWRPSAAVPESTHRAPGEWAAASGSTEPAPSGNGATYPAERNGYHASEEAVTAPAPALPPEGPSAPVRPATEARLIAAEDRYRPAGDSTSPPWADANGSSEPGRLPGSAVRRHAPALASTMTVGVRASSRSPLLPRSTDVDIEALLEEISTLRADIAVALPPGQEASERSRHLLNKAQNLLQSDPSRSAEVDYYLQQVRRTVQRTRQTREGSAIYRQRMTFYLTGWILLATVVIGGIILYRYDLQASVQRLFDLPDASPVARFAALIAAATFAGALGAAVAILINMGRHARQKYGYFDRKYGLRCLLLPLLGLFFGSLIGLAWSLVYWVAAIDPATTLVAWLAPLFLGFCAGFGQEWLYGAR